MKRGNVVIPGNPVIEIDKAGTLVGVRPRLNFIQGSGVTITAVDDAADDRVNLTIASTGGGGSIGSMSAAAFGALVGNGGYSLIRTTDGVYERIWNGSAWDHYYEGIYCVPPDFSVLSTTRNGGGGSITDLDGAALISSNISSGVYTGKTQAYPGTPFTLEVLIDLQYYPAMYPEAGIIIDGDAGKSIAFTFSYNKDVFQMVCGASRRNAGDGWNSSYFGANPILWDGPIYFSLQDTGTNLVFKVYRFPGCALTLLTVSRTEYLSSLNAIGIVVSTSGGPSFPTYALFPHYKLT